MNWQSPFHKKPAEQELGGSMYTNMSRSDRLLDLTLNVAKEGKFSFKAMLYPSEMKRVKKQWHVNVTQLSGSPSDTGTYNCLISWDSVFSETGLNFQQSWYISGLQDEFPKVGNIAERLFIISACNSK